ncbi:hypothetical protein E2P86_02945 [Sphingobacterium psychroaquaticum]|uniref:LiaI-LiaF-like domain-containing protein n=1 Tax=Sphingobacterium psychroaquaticum TaxID=561061 RepID=UPI00106B935C|nr:DUF5668 domain-containing protein [Sphingobacterium psychroaquaticum]QBQ40160.1 hypothetical protein E2P86_02945 [Sphingobacterium psychroaquaticum]
MENKITSGIWFVFIGLILLLHNLNVIDFNFWATLKFWPLLIVIIGINLMVQNKTYGTYIKIGANVLFLGWILFVGLTSRSSDWREALFTNRNVNISDLDGDEHFASEVSLPLDSLTTEAKLEFNGGAGTFNLKAEASNNLIHGINKDNSSGLYVKGTVSDSMPKVELNVKPLEKKQKKAGPTDITLNSNVLWNMELNYGAATIAGDLSTLRVKTLEINTGASTMSLKLGMPQSGVSSIEIATGASTIDFNIPKDAAVRVKYSAFLSSNSFEGLETKGKGVAQTQNFDAATNKYEIQIDGAANTFSIHRY